ncbi:MAG: peptidoglycan D,D-transpeptidase FtsI family protein [Nitrospirota bacterium]
MKRKIYKRKEKKTEGKGRIVVITIFVFVYYGIILYRLYYLQVQDSQHLNKIGDRMIRKTVKVEGERGTIYDRNMNIIAVNMDTPSIYARPSLIKDHDYVSKRLATILNMDYGYIKKRLRKRDKFVWIARKVDRKKAMEIKKMNIPGIEYTIESQRFYPKGYLLSNMIGFAGIDNHGLEGVERKYDKFLRGKKEKITLERDGKGHTLFPTGLDYLSVPRGNDLILTIDEVIQHIAEKELDMAINSSKAKGGSVIAMDPDTGEILAMATYPRFNPNMISSYSPDEWRNRAITDIYEPGSTFKIIVAAGAIEENKAFPEDIIDREDGTIKIGRKTIRDFSHGKSKERFLTFREVIEKSSNVGMIKVGMRLGEERLLKYIKLFGFGTKTGIDLLGEVKGLVRNIKEWSGLSLASLSIGQEIGVTPIQLITAVATVANEGLLMSPYVISRIMDQDGKVVKQNHPQIIRRVISKETSRQLTDILTGVVSDRGTGKNAIIEGYMIAGKTGTAQKIDPVTKRYSHRKSVCSFIGFFPIDNPKVIILVVIDEPAGYATGGSVAAPVFRNIAREIIYYWGITPHTIPSPLVGEG